MDTMSSTTRASTRESGPQLVFDDGSRVSGEIHNPEVRSIEESVTVCSRPTSISIREYYEIDRLCQEIMNHDAWRRVALQFPDDLLQDAPEVCWQFEQALGIEALVFCLSDTTTNASCCPDHVAAAHLQADCLVHYGHACLSSFPGIPVLYSFGRGALSLDACVQSVLDEIGDEKTDDLCFLLLYEVSYQFAIEEMANRLRKNNVSVISGQVPETAHATLEEGTCGESKRTGKPCCSRTIARNAAVMTEANALSTDLLLIGGLCLPIQNDWSNFTLLYIGDDRSRHFMSIALQFLSSTCPKAFWTWQPDNNQLVVDEQTAVVQRKLRSRFYLIEKARTCLVFGILVTNLSDMRIQSVVVALQRLLSERDRAYYTFIVGKVLPATLLNFAAVQCFVLVSCPEQSLVENSREFPIPIITPAEVAISLGIAGWGAGHYSLQHGDFLKLVDNPENVSVDEQDFDRDAPYFSLATGRYEPKPTQGASKESSNLSDSTQLSVYSSAAAEFLKTRDYQGLVVERGASGIKEAIPGQTGIASNYNSH